MSVCYTFVLKFHFLTQQLLFVGVQGLVLSPGTHYPHYASLRFITLLVFERSTIII